MNIRKRLENRGIMVEEWMGKGEDFRRRWERTFAGAISPQEKQSIDFGQFLWQVFSYEKLPCLEGKTAMRAFHEENRFVLLKGKKRNGFGCSINENSVSSSSLVKLR